MYVQPSCFTDGRGHFFPNQTTSSSPQTMATAAPAKKVTPKKRPTAAPAKKMVPKRKLQIG